MFNIESESNILEIFLELNNVEAIECILKTSLKYRHKSKKLFYKICDYYFGTMRVDEIVDLVKNYQFFKVILFL